MVFQHLKERASGGNLLHISHLLPMVSAYEITTESWKELRDFINEAYTKAKESGTSQVTDMDGLMTLLVHPNGVVQLAVVLRSFDIPKQGELLNE